MGRSIIARVNTLFEKSHSAPELREGLGLRRVERGPGYLPASLRREGGRKGGREGGREGGKEVRPKEAIDPMNRP